MIFPPGLYIVKTESIGGVVMNSHNYAASATREKYCLNGFWQFACGNGDLDQLPDQYEATPIQVPSPYNVNGFMKSYTRSFCGEESYVQGGDFRLYPEYPPHWETAKCGFYCRTFLVPEHTEGNRLFLRFDAVAFHCKFYLNGQLLAETMEGFLPIELEITQIARYGQENTLVVACQTAGYLTYKGLDGRSRLDYPKGSFWGEQIAGIWQDAWLVVRPQTYIEQLQAVTDVDTRTLTVAITAQNAQNCGVAMTLKKWNTNENEKQIVTASSVGTLTWTWQEEEVELWDFLQPNLYVLAVRLIKAGQVVDEKVVRIGFRTMKAEGEKFVLNGRPINLKSDAWHYLGYTVQTPEYARAYYQMALDAGVNVIRLHAQPFPEFFLDIADEMGMLLVSESAVWASHCIFSYSPAFFEHAKEHLVGMVLRDRNHPSVVMWSPENECIPAYMFCGSDHVKSIAELEEQIYDFIKVIDQYDTTRLISCDGSGDLGGRLPVNSLHYPHYDCPTKRGKPITIGEMGSMYYSTPDTVSREFGGKTLQSFDGRLESIGREAYRDLIGQRKWASQICIFNLVWYGLKPLPFCDRPLVYEDYTLPGIKPSRITPYMRTLNAGAQPELPAYIPNIVWELTRDAYLPTRTFVEDPPKTVAMGRATAFRLTTFNDWRQAGNFTLTATLTQPGVSRAHILQFALPACDYREDTLSFVPQKSGDALLTVTLSAEGRVIHSADYPLQVVDVEELTAKFDQTGVAVVTEGPLPVGVPVLDCRLVKPYSETMKAAAQQHFFADNTVYAYQSPVDCYVFDECLCFGGIPCLTDGKGAAVAMDLTCLGQPRILSGLDLSANDPVTAQIRLALAQKLRQTPLQECAKPYYLGNLNAETAAMLTELGCDFEPISPEKLEEQLGTPTNRLLIVDGSSGFDHFHWFSSNNFKNVLATNLKKIPTLFCNRLQLQERTLFHLAASEDCRTRLGLDSNALYGLETNQEQILASRVMQCNQPSEAILLGVPNIDWRMWNHNAEPLKTVAILRGEQRNESQNGVLIRQEYAGSAIYLSTLSADVGSNKAKHIWARILSRFGAEIALRQSDERSRLLYSGMYSGRVRRMLTRQAAPEETIADAKPALNQIQNGNAWIIADREMGQNRLYGLYVTSPQDRRDLLMNPDYVDMHITAQSPAKVYINGQPVGEGTDFDLTGIPLQAGVNCLLIHIAQESLPPEIIFRRINGKALDLTFGLADGTAKPLAMEKATFWSTHNLKDAALANATIERFWSSNQVQQKNMTLAWQFSEPVQAKALWFASFRFDNQGNIGCPQQFRLLAGESSDHLQPVYQSLAQEQMCYPSGRIYLEFDRPVTARYFALQLTENATKEWLVSDLTLLG